MRPGSGLTRREKALDARLCRGVDKNAPVDGLRNAGNLDIIINDVDPLLSEMGFDKRPKLLQIGVILKRSNILIGKMPEDGSILKLSGESKMTDDTISRELKYDVLIIGGGGAAGRAAIASASAGAKTLVVLKKKLGASGATTHKCCEIAGFNVPGCGDTNDTRETYLKDILDAALNMAKPELAGLLADNAKDRFEELRAWGVHPAEDNGKPIVMKGCYSNYRRGYTIKGHGEPIMHALIAQMQKLGVDIMEESMAVDLLMSGNRCCGALVLDENDRLVLVRAKATILATGGASRVFLNNLNPGDVSGDGYSLAYDNGAELMNMEFMQAGIGFFYPAKSLFNTYLWAGFPKLMNRSGEAFLQKYLPEGISEKDVMLMHCRHFPFSSNDISKYLEIGIQKELEAGGGTERMCVPVSLRVPAPEPQSHRPTP